MTRHYIISLSTGLNLRCWRQPFVHGLLIRILLTTTRERVWRLKRMAQSHLLVLWKMWRPTTTVKVGVLRQSVVLILRRHFPLYVMSLGLYNAMFVCNKQLTSLLLYHNINEWLGYDTSEVWTSTNSWFFLFRKKVMGESHWNSSFGDPNVLTMLMKLVLINFNS